MGSSMSNRSPGHVASADCCTECTLWPLVWASADCCTECTLCDPLCGHQLTAVQNVHCDPLCGYQLTAVHNVLYDPLCGHQLTTVQNVHYDLCWVASSDTRNECALWPFLMCFFGTCKGPSSAHCWTNVLFNSADCFIKECAKWPHGWASADWWTKCAI